MKKFLLVLSLISVSFFSAGASYYTALFGCQPGYSNQKGGGTDVYRNRYIYMNFNCSAGNQGSCWACMHWTLEKCIDPVYDEWMTWYSDDVTDSASCGSWKSLFGRPNVTDAQLIFFAGHGTYRMTANLYGNNCTTGPKLGGYVYTWTL